jgi:hypothetical protein
MVGDWPHCGHLDVCAAVPVVGAERCWAHLPVDALQTALDKLAPGVDLDLRGVTLGDDLLRRILEPLRDPDDGQLRIGAALCQDATFTDPIALKDVVIAGDATFTGGRFKDATFEAVRIGGTTDFSAAVFDGTTTFTHVGFAGAVSFANCVFGTVTFSYINADCGLSLRNSSVGGLKLVTTDPPCGAGTLDLSGLRATGEVDLRAGFSLVRGDRAKFSSRASLQLAGSELWLEDSVFEQPATVESWLRASRAREPGGSRRRRASGEQLVRVRSLRGVDAEHLTLSDSDLSGCLIYGLRRPEQLRLEGRCEFARTPPRVYLRWRWLPWRWTSREVLYEEYLWRRDTPLAALGWDSPMPGPEAQQDDPEAPLPTAARLTVLYRQLRQGLEDAKNEPGAADLYYGEMEMRRLSTKGRAERWLLTAYWLVSGYGLRASRSMLVLGCLIVAAAEALQRTGFGHHPRHPGFIDCLLYAAGSVLSLGLSGHLPATLSDWGQVIRMVLRIGGPVLLGLGALAVRGRVKR